MPLLTTTGFNLLQRLLEHPHAPRWNHNGGDGLDRPGLTAVQRYAEALSASRGVRRPGEIPTAVRRWLTEQRSRVPLFRVRLPKEFHAEKTWEEIETMSREDVAVRMERLVPDDADLEEMIVYRTAGTTGHALLVPNTPKSVACYQPMVELALRRHGIRPRFGPDAVAGFLVGAQVRTVTCPSVLAYWKGAGFAKLNLNRAEWPAPDSPHRYFEEFAPFFLSGDPISFAEMMRQEIPAKPAALISTAVAMSAALRRKLSGQYDCPVIEWYSLTETGPIGYACPRGHGYHLLPHDLFVEAVDASGRPVPTGERGEITLTGGRNPFLPLLRYRTGDWGRLDFGKCRCGDPMPRILDLEGRAPVLFRASDGTVVNTVDISRVLREFPFVQHEFVQRSDLACELVARPVAGGGALNKTAIERELRRLFGKDIRLDVRFDPQLGNRRVSDKVAPYRSELLLED